jgi:hypothetical protein
MKTIAINIDCETGKTEVATDGFAGAECLKATAELEKALGATRSDVKTPEYNKRASVGAREKQGR